MSGLGTKTPVSCLQEYLVSKKLIPQYELTHNGVGTHNPEFTFRVRVEALWEEGTARSKREAKHKAAEKMLKSLKIIDAKAEEQEVDEFKKEIENHVGQLKDLCITLHYPEPRYYLEEAAGPPHNRIFKMVCCVSQLQDFGISRTKQQAKHQAASKMLQRLKEVVGEKIENALTSLESPITAPAPYLTDEEVTEKYRKINIKSSGDTTQKDPAAFYKDNHKAYVCLKERSPTLSEILNMNNMPSIKNSLGLLQQIAKELETEINSVQAPKRCSGLKFTVMTMSVFPPLGGIGIGEEQAAFNLLNSLLLLCN